MKTTGYSSLFLHIAVTFLAISFFPGVANTRGDLIFADSFAYPEGVLAGDGPPPGSPPGQGGWTVSNGSPRVAKTGLRFPGIYWVGRSTIVNSPAHTNGDKAVAELLPVTAANDGVVWVGFLVSKTHGALVTHGYAVVSLGNDATGPSLGIGMLFEENLYGLDNNTGENGSRSATNLEPSEETVWMVTKVDFINAKEVLWVNPAPGAEPDVADAAAHLPMTAEFLSSGFSEIVLKIGYTKGIFHFDEVRVGTAFADVVSPSIIP
ncbi:MAG: hypothetical protein H0X34_14820 [Chthoniobacterales bacterium]|nr:hypothetical protein [Chthoniobacterales bacterium]